MGENTDEMIKKAISEEIVEEMFRDMGFYVVKLGKEYAVSPLAQLQPFINKLTKDSQLFQLQKTDKEFVTPVDYVNKLPDFVVVNQFGTVILIEVKYRVNGVPWDDDLQVFDVYDQAILLVVNCYYYHEKRSDFPSNVIENLKKTRFHIWQQSENGEDVSAYTLDEWLLLNHGIDATEHIKRYEEYVTKWFETVRQWEKGENKRSKNKLKESKLFTKY